MSDFNRRQFIKGLAVAGLAAGQASAMSSAPQEPDERELEFPQDVDTWHTGTTGDLPRQGVPPSEGLDYPIRTYLPFAHGVASGDPVENGVIIWTRITLENYPAETLLGEWRIASDPMMRNIVQSGDFSTTASRDWTVKIDVTDLTPYSTYYYQFFYNGAESCVGRTRTAPAQWQEIESLRVAVAACSSYYSGYMNGYSRIAERQDIDVVVHCGDYIYDFPDAEELIRIPNGQANNDNIDFRRPQNLAEARRRFALYRSDPDLFRAHQQHPFIIIWDNHDIAANNFSREEAYQAYWEWTPTRQPDDNDIFRGHRRLSYGQIADFLVTDRHYPDRYPETEASDPSQDYLGISQNQWLREALLDSQQRQSHWRLMVNQAFMAQLHLIDPPSGIDWVLEAIFPDYQDGIVLNNGQWDGSPQERQALFEFLRDHGIENTIVFTGDMHMNWGSDLNEDPANLFSYDPVSGRGSVGVEFAPSSISRGGADETVFGAVGGNDNPVARQIGALGSQIASTALVTSNIAARYMEWTEHGYGVAHITAEQALFEYWWTPILEVSDQQRLGQQLVCERGSQHLEAVNVPTATQRSNLTDQALAPEVQASLLLQTV